MAKREFEMNDVLHVARQGAIRRLPEYDIKQGTWEYVVEGLDLDGKKLEIVFAIDEKKRVMRGRFLNIEKCPQCGRRMRRTTLDHYKYVESGLSNVYLYGIAAYQCSCGEEVLHLPNIEGLHSLIVQKLLKKPSQLKGEELRFIRKYVGLKAAELAKMLSVDPSTVSKWETGESLVGPAYDKFFRLSVTVYMSERLKDTVADWHRKAADAYLDFLNEIRSRETKDTDDDTVNITSEELRHPPLMFTPISAPSVLVEVS